MKTIGDVQYRLKVELNHWCGRQSRDLLSDFYLWYRPTTPERDGEIMIAREQPSPDYELAWGQRINKAGTVEQNFNLFCSTGILGRLPVLEY